MKRREVATTEGPHPEEDRGKQLGLPGWQPHREGQALMPWQRLGLTTQVEGVWRLELGSEKWLGKWRQMLNVRLQCKKATEVSRQSELWSSACETSRGTATPCSGLPSGLWADKIPVGHARHLEEASQPPSCALISDNGGVLHVSCGDRPCAGWGENRQSAVAVSETSPQMTGDHRGAVLQHVWHPPKGKLWKIIWPLCCVPTERRCTVWGGGGGAPWLSVQEGSLHFLSHHS